MAGSRTNVLVALPRPLTSLIGREQELAHLLDLLGSEVALVTITGFGGIGKTRLALQTALELEPTFTAGAIFASLASVTRGSSIPRAIALTAGLDESIDTVEKLAAALGESSRLLVLDNLEQIPDAAEIVMQLLQHMPQATVLTTSRSRLEISGEYVLPLDPLETHADELRSVPAVRLFIERGKAVLPSLPVDDASVEIIAEICQKLDGIPLAIELAAARLAIFTVTDLRDQLENILPVLASKRRDMPDRQKTMRNAIAWTYELLEQPDRRLFTWLSVYEQDFSLDSVRHVARQLELSDDPLDLVHFLVSRNLIRQSRRESDSPRYQMLQMLREFGHEQLVITREDHLARRSHATDMLTLAEQAEPHFLTRTGTHWMLRLSSDVPNLLGAMHWANTHNLPEIPLRVLGSIWRFARKSGFGRQFLLHVPESSGHTADSRIHARALIGIGNLHEALGETEPAQQAFLEAQELARNLPDQRVHVAALSGLALTAHDKSDMRQLEAYANAAHDLAISIDDPTGQDIAAGLIAMHHIQTGRAGEAIPVLQELVTNANLRGDTGSEAGFTGNLGVALQIEERYEESKQYILRTIELAEESGNFYSAAIGYVNLTSAHLLLKEYDQVRAYGEKGLLVARQAGQVISEVSLLNNLASVYKQQGEYGTAAHGLAHAVGLINHDGGIGQHVQIVGEYIDMCLALGMKAEAAELLGAVRAVRQRLNLAPYPWEAEGEDAAYAQLNPEANPEFAHRISQGALLDRKGMVQRMREISALIEAHQPASMAATVEPPPKYAVTPREKEVIAMLAQGLSNAEIAEEMFVSTRTVTTHLTNIFTKLSVNNRSRAVAVAMQVGLV